MYRLFRLLPFFVAGLTGGLHPRLAGADDPPAVRVTVVVVLATTENNVVDPKLTALAKEVQKRDESLVGFKLAATVSKSIPVGESHTFDLVEKQELVVKIDKPRGADG